ncbi:zinc-dependent alcohol dehydrogenase family protein [Methylovulum miyakonense]|uniref:zinc-dependent alcohol dehydrogenase family protein n=1 Tax=Methylovulum miyakonense TaxID=645578 RepID=UPI000365951C|nr:zinc-dependent alcohol dehydrogenase family protein [Methylovulum miyakonense]
MKAMVLNKPCNLKENPTPLELMEIPVPVPDADGILLKVSSCGVCHTELDEIEGRTPPPRLPIILGHQVIGRVEAIGKQVSDVGIGDRMGVAWIFSACGRCKFCLAGMQNLCPEFQATGRDANGGYAQYMTVARGFAYTIPDIFSDVEAAPLLCAGAIGYRSLRLTGLKDGQRLGLTGFGASAHLVLKMVKHRYPDTDVYVFARSAVERQFALELGAVWAGGTAERAPHKLDSIIDTTPAWQPIVEALANLESGGRLVINAIRKEGGKQSLLDLDYPQHLWQEKEIKSVANITQADVTEFLSLAADMGLKPEIQEFSLEQANEALMALKDGPIRGAKVLKIG